MLQKDEALAQFLDRLYHDIRAIEEQYAMQAGKSDLRLPVEYYHDAVRAWRNGREQDAEHGQGTNVQRSTFDVQRPTWKNRRT